MNHHWIAVTEKQWHLYVSIGKGQQFYVGNVTKKADEVWIATVRPRYGLTYTPGGRIRSVARWMQELAEEKGAYASDDR